MKAMKTSMLAAAALAAACGASAGVTATWTGAADAYWTNAANWLVEGDVPAKCPGALMYADADPDLPSCDEAVFDATCTSGRTTIDLDGLYSVSNVIVRGAECPKYTFGSSTDQLLMLEVKGNFTIESTVPAESCPIVEAELGTGNFSYSWWGKPGIGTVMIVRNDSAGKLVFNSRFCTQRRRDAEILSSEYMEPAVTIAGTGDFEFNAEQTPPHLWLLSFSNWDGATMRFNKNFLCMKRMNTYKDTRFVIAKDATFGSFVGNNVGMSINSGGVATMEGEGTFRIVENNNAKFSSRGSLNIYNGRIDVRSKVECYSSNVTTPRVILSTTTSNAERCLKLCGEPADFPGGVIFEGSPQLAALGTNKLGNCGAFIVTNAVQSANATFCWISANEGEALTVPIEFHGPESSVFMVENKGSRPFTVSSAVTAPDGAKTLYLNGSEAPVVFNATLPSQGIALKLAKKVVIPEAASLANCTAISVLGGADVTFEGTAARTLPSVSVASGANSISFTGATTMTFSGISIAGGSLDIKTADSGASVVFDGKTSADAPPAGLTLDGLAPAFDDNGRLYVQSSSVDVQIAARGDVVPDAPSSVVGITSAGSGEADTLAADATAVAGIVQQNPAAAEIAIGEGQVLTAGEVAIDHGFGNFAVGSVSGQGALAAASSPLVLRNDSPVGTLSVNAALASADLEKKGDCKVSLLGGMTPPVGGMLLRSGETSIAGGTWNTTSATRIVVTNKAALSICGDARVISDAGATSVNRSIPTINIEGGLLKIGGNAVITNRIVMNYSLQTRTSAIHQDGGTLYLQGDTANNFYFFDYKGSGYSKGYWDISGGTVALSGKLAIAGSFSNAGIHQSGGRINSAASPFRICAGSSCNAEFVMTGGTNTFANINLRDWGTYSDSRGVFTMDGPEAMATVNGQVQMVYENNENPAALTYGMLNLVSGVFCANGAKRGGTYHSAEHRVKSKAYINFNGGTFKTRADTSPPPTYGLFGGSESDTSSEKSWIDYVTIYKGGAVIETDASNRKVYISNPLRAPTGKGVASIDFAAYEGQKTGLMAPPIVMIEGDGQGASAYAVFDAASGSITGIRVVSPGWGYTTATAKLYYGSMYNATGVVCPLTLADAESGGLTKKGEGKLFLGAVNTYTGDTVLKGGVLSLYTAGALPAESTVVYDGGSLESKAAAFPSSIKVRIPGAETDSVRSHLIATFTDSLPETPPVVEVVNSPAGTTRDWRARYGSGKKLYARRIYGFSLMIR